MRRGRRERNVWEEDAEIPAADDDQPIAREGVNDCSGRDHLAAVVEVEEDDRRRDIDREAEEETREPTHGVYLGS